MEANLVTMVTHNMLAMTSEIRKWKGVKTDVCPVSTCSSVLIT